MNQPFIKRYSELTISLLLVAFYVTAQILYFAQNGIVTTHEAEKYIHAANKLTQFQWPHIKYLFYSLYVFFLAICFKIGIGYIGVAIIQVFINAVATFFLYRVSINLFNKKFIGFITVLLFIISYQAQIWNFCLYTESLFLNLSIFFFYYLSKNKQTQKNLLALLFFLILLIFTRPTGLLYIPVFLAFVLLSRHNQPIITIKKKFWLIGSFLMLFILGLCFNYFYILEGLLNAFFKKQVICGYDLDVQDNFVGIFFYKLVYFLGMIRPYYSNLHNLLLLLFLPVYLFFLVGIAKPWQNPVFFKSCLFLVFLVTVSVLVTCVNWHGRFIVPLIPIWVIFGGHGLYRTYHLILKKLKN